MFKNIFYREIPPWNLSEPHWNFPETDCVICSPTPIYKNKKFRDVSHRDTIQDPKKQNRTELPNKKNSPKCHSIRESRYSLIQNSFNFIITEFFKYLIYFQLLKNISSVSQLCPSPGDFRRKRRKKEKKKFHRFKTLFLWKFSLRFVYCIYSF